MNSRLPHAPDEHKASTLQRIVREDLRRRERAGRSADVPHGGSRHLDPDPAVVARSPLLGAVERDCPDAVGDGFRSKHEVELTRRGRGIVAVCPERRDVLAVRRQLGRPRISLPVSAQ